MTELPGTHYNLMGLIFVLGTIISMSLSLTIKHITVSLGNSRLAVVAGFSQRTNWLPSHAPGELGLTMRLYEALPAILNSTSTPPPDLPKELPIEGAGFVTNQAYCLV